MNDLKWIPTTADLDRITNNLYKKKIFRYGSGYRYTIVQETGGVEVVKFRGAEFLKDYHRKKEKNEVIEMECIVYATCLAYLFSLIGVDSHLLKIVNSNLTGDIQTRQLYAAGETHQHISERFAYHYATVGTLNGINFYCDSSHSTHREEATLTTMTKDWYLRSTFATPSSQLYCTQQSWVINGAI